MCLAIVCLVVDISIALMFFVYLFSWFSGYNDAAELGHINESVADCRARILILNYMEKHHIDILNIDDVLTIFPANYGEGEEND